MKYFKKINLLKLSVVVAFAFILSSCDFTSMPEPAGHWPQDVANVTESGFLTVSVENNGGTFDDEGSSSLIDGDKTTKFYCGGYTPDFWAQQTFQSPVKIDAYSITSGNDSPNRDPKAWTLKGSKDGVTWTVIESKKNANFGLRKQTKIYHLESQVSYQYYRLYITKNSGSSSMQLSDWLLLNYHAKNNGSKNPNNEDNEFNRMRIISISSHILPIGMKLTIKGVNFASSASGNTVIIGHTKANIVSASSGKIEAIIPTNIDFKKYVVYVKANGEIAASHVALDVISNNPKIESFQPREGGVGTKVTISGASFSPNKSGNIVRFGHVKAVVKSAEPNKLVVMVPEGLDAGKVTLSVKVKSSGKKVTAPNKFNYFRVLVPTSIQKGRTWKYKVYIPNYQNLRWTKLSYDDSDWKTGVGGFGSFKNYRVKYARTEWEGYDIYLRKTFTIKDLSDINTGSVSIQKPDELVLKMWHDDWVDVYINGVLAAHANGFTTSYEYFTLSKASKQALREGKNIIAIHDHQNSGGQYIDLGLMEIDRSN